MSGAERVRAVPGPAAYELPPALKEGGVRLQPQVARDLQVFKDATPISEADRHASVQCVWSDNARC